MNERHGAPLLTELRLAPWLAWLVGTLGGGFALGVTAAVAGAIAIYLARLGCADCFCITLTHDSTTLKIVFGYIAELNHGPFQMLGVPILLPLAGWLLEMVHHELKVLAARGRFFRWSAAGSPEPIGDGLAEIGRLNRRWFTWLTPLAFLVPFAVVSLVESRSYNAEHVGWVQAEFFGAWSGAGTLDALGNENFRRAAGARLRALEEAKSKDPGNQARATKEETAASVAGTPEAVKVSLVRREPGTQRNRWTRPFVALALALQALSVGYFAWLGLKLLFMFGLVYYLVRGCRLAAEFDDAFLRRLATCPAKNTPNAAEEDRGYDAPPKSGVQPRSPRLLLFVDCFDQKERFGLKVFDRVYDLALVLLAIGATTLLLSALANLPRGTGLLEGGLFVMLLVYVPSVAMALAPAILLNSETLNVGHRVRERLAQENAAGANVSPEYQECLDLASEQTAWPRGDWMFKVLGSAIVSLFVLWGALTLAIKVDADTYGKLVYAIAEGLPQRLCQICE